MSVVTEGGGFRGGEGRETTWGAKGTKHTKYLNNSE